MSPVRHYLILEVVAYVQPTPELCITLTLPQEAVIGEVAMGTVSVPFALTYSTKFGRPMETAVAAAGPNLQSQGISCSDLLSQTLAHTQKLQLESPQLASILQAS